MEFDLLDVQVVTLYIHMYMCKAAEERWGFVRAGAPKVNQTGYEPSKESLFKSEAKPAIENWKPPINKRSLEEAQASKR